MRDSEARSEARPIRGGRSARPAVERIEVLVVEDCEDQRAMLCDVLSLAGLAVRSAIDVASAMSEIDARKPDVVIADLQLEGGDEGVALGRRLRAGSQTSELPLIAISGVVEPEWSRVRHFDAYLRKPIDPAMLLPLIRRLAGAADLGGDHAPRARDRAASAIIDIAPSDVLVVEDDPSTREALCAMLSGAGFRTRAVGDAQSALAAIAQQVPGVIVTDLNLGDGEDGVDLARLLRGADVTAQLGVIAVSGAVEPEWARVRHFDAYLRKPIHVPTLLSLIRRFA